MAMKGSSSMKTHRQTSVQSRISVASRGKRPGVPSTTFSLYAPGAQEVFVLGDFNGWQRNELKARKFKDGTWRKSVPLQAGIYQYLFLVDGEWWTDPANPKRVQNPYGTENSVIEIG
ncbi:MAG: isoamylase early set domain-containing protein [Desulfobulbaceae bacterium]|nr:isoamylase early set domain-containing protein [Desulfobulbaceae bacterium]